MVRLRLIQPHQRQFSRAVHVNSEFVLNVVVTRLAEREVNGSVWALQQMHRSFACLRIEHIPQTRDKQGHPQWLRLHHRPGHVGFSVLRPGSIAPALIPVDSKGAYPKNIQEGRKQ